MDFESIHLVESSLICASTSEVNELETTLGTQIPAGYREYITTLGTGILNDSVRVYSPKRILREYREVQNRWQKNYFWDEGQEVLGKEQVLESIVIADTGNGDEVIFHPSDPNQIYVLPIDHGGIFRAGSNLDEAIDWILDGGVLNVDEDEEDEEEVESPEGRYFEPFSPDASG